MGNPPLLGVSSTRLDTANTDRADTVYSQKPSEGNLATDGVDRFAARVQARTSSLLQMLCGALATPSAIVFAPPKNVRGHTFEERVKARCANDHEAARVGPEAALLSSYAVTYRVVEFSSHGATLRGRLYRPDRATRPPLVIMAHGTSATITMVSDRFAEAFADGGLAVLLYDHRGFGGSDGEPRQEVNPWVQVRGILDALAFAETLRDEVDTARIGLWGLSYAGSLVIGATAIDRRCRAMVVQVPACSAEPAPQDPDGALFAALRSTLERGELAAPPLAITGPLPVVASDQINNRSLLTPLSAFRWFMEHGSRHGCLWENRITRIIPTTPAPFHAGLCAPHIAVPSLWIIAVDDEMAGSNPIVSRGVFDAAGGRKELIEVHGGHFAGLYPPAPPFEALSGAARDFFRRELVA